MRAARFDYPGACIAHLPHHALHPRPSLPPTLFAIYTPIQPARQPLCIAIDCATFQSPLSFHLPPHPFQVHLQPRCVTLGDAPVPTCTSSQPLVLDRLQHFSLCIAAAGQCHALLTCQSRPPSPAPAADSRLHAVLRPRLQQPVLGPCTSSVLHRGWRRRSAAPRRACTPTAARSLLLHVC